MPTPDDTQQIRIGKYTIRTDKENANMDNVKAQDQRKSSGDLIIDLANKTAEAKEINQ